MSNPHIEALPQILPLLENREALYFSLAVFAASLGTFAEILRQRQAVRLRDSQIQKMLDQQHLMMDQATNPDFLNYMKRNGKK